MAEHGAAVCGRAASGSEGSPMTRIKHSHGIADIEPSIALANTLIIEREQSITVSIPDAHSFHRDPRKARVVYIKELFVRAFTVLTSGGLDEVVVARPPSHAGKSVRSGAKSA